MSISTPSRRLTSRWLSSHSPLHYQQRRTATKDFMQRGASASQQSTSKDSPTSRPNPVLDEYLRKNPSNLSAPAPQMPSPGDLASSSIFEDDRREQEYHHGSQPPFPATDRDATASSLPGRSAATIARITDPDPNARERWERKKVMQLVRRGGRLTRAQLRQRTEREHVAKSHNLKTSVKKLGLLVRQIAGKTLDEAIVQMRFSKKKAAVEVRAQLEAARDEAVVMRGMGLGQAQAPGSSAAADQQQQQQQQQQQKEGEQQTPLEIQLKDGRRHRVTDPSKIYVDQAWVGRGPYGKLPEFRARGRVNLLRTPWTSFTVLLKEEATRVREWQEREAKRKRQRTGDKVWTALPDRPIQIQRQWYSW